MSEDAIKVELNGLHQDVTLLREEGRARGEKIDQMLERTVDVEVRVEKLEDDGEANRERFKELDSRIWKMAGLLAIALGGVEGARELWTMIFQ
ncbi:MAG: hypothetical protein IJW12_05725 [Opitutales bacterium]|nr:hypothetical protein [Opitutales bacterium]